VNTKTSATSKAPFACALVPYDGSEPSGAALDLAIALAAMGVKIVVSTVVDEAFLISESVDAIVSDPSPLMDELDAQGNALLEQAVQRARAAGVDAAKELRHERPVPGILASAEARGCDLIIMGTHARTGLSHTFLGSTTEGVLRLSRIPVLTVRGAERIGAAPFSSVMVALDESKPSEAAAAVAARLMRDAGARIAACYVVDATPVYESAGTYAFDPEPLLTEMREEGTTIVRSAMTRAGIPADAPASVIEGEPAAAIIEAARSAGATLIVSGTHGRGGIARFVLGSVAEHLVRSSPIPVLVVPVSR
jgi:nucleotide-binding universal stress UspA family protein